MEASSYTTWGRGEAYLTYSRDEHMLSEALGDTLGNVHGSGLPGLSGLLRSVGKRDGDVSVRLF